MKKIAVFPGSFDPIHEGHIDIIKRASKLFDQVYVLMAINCGKTDKIPEQSYQLLLKEINKLNLSNVIVDKTEGLTTDFLKKVNAKYIIRSVRNTNDFAYEQMLYDAYKSYDEQIEEVLFIANKENRNLSSTKIRKGE